MTESVFSWNLPTTKYLHIKLYNTDAAKQGLPLAAKIGIGVGATAVGITGAVIAAPFVLAGIGFTAGGVAVGSIAAAWQASIGSVAAGSLFASLQSAGAAGLGAAGLAAAGAVGATAAGTVGGIIAGGVKTNISVKVLDEAFLPYVKQKYEIVTYEDLRNILKELKLTFKDDELKEKFQNVTGRNSEGLITYREFLRLFGVKLLNGQELKTKLTKVFNKKTMFFITKEIYFKSVKGMIESLGVTLPEENIKSSYAFVKELDSFEPETATVTCEDFLKMFGCDANPYFDLEHAINFYEGYKNENGYINLKDLFSFSTSDSTDLTLIPCPTFYITFEEYLEFFEIGLEYEPLKAVLIFKLSILYFEFINLASTIDNTISLIDAEDILIRREMTNTISLLNLFQKEKKEEKKVYLDFLQFLELLSEYVDFHKLLNISESNINPQFYILTWKLLDYLIALNYSLNRTGTLKVWDALKKTTGNDSPRILSYFEFLKVLLVLDLPYHSILIIPEHNL